MQTVGRDSKRVRGRTASPGARHRRGRAIPGDRCPARGTKVIVMTDGRTNLTHYITDQAARRGRAQGGRYVACCGAVVLPASLTAPDGAGCRACASWAQQGGFTA